MLCQGTQTKHSTERQRCEKIKTAAETWRMDHQGSKNHWIGIPEGDKRGTGGEAICEKIIAKNFHN